MTRDGTAQITRDKLAGLIEMAEVINKTKKEKPRTAQNIG